MTPTEKFDNIITNYIKNIEEDLTDRWNNWDKDLTAPEQYEVIGGLMARQITITINFLSCSSIWNGHIAPIILRSLIDSFINFAWIFEQPDERSKKFIYYGVGQAKLQLEHYKEERIGKQLSEAEELIIKAREYWINSQRFDFLTDVSLKNWSDFNVRQMAEEANCLDIYNYAYQPFSSAVHNMWNHISRYNLIESQNPLHKFFRKPGIFNDEPHHDYIYLAAKYVHRMFYLFDEKTGYKPNRISSFDILTNDFEEMNKWMEEQEQNTKG